MFWVFIKLEFYVEYIERVIMFVLVGLIGFLYLGELYKDEEI